MITPQCRIMFTKKRIIKSYFPFSNFRMKLLVLLLILPIHGTNCELTESVIFQPVDNIQTSKSSWIFSAAVNFTPYLRSLRSVFSYGRNVKERVVAFKSIFHRQHP